MEGEFDLASLKSTMHACGPLAVYVDILGFCSCTADGYLNRSLLGTI